MKQLTCISVFALFACFPATKGHGQAIELTFTAQHNGQYIAVDSIAIHNLSQGGDTVLYAPDTVLSLPITTGVTEGPAHIHEAFTLEHPRPNPFSDKTSVHIGLAGEESLNLAIIDLMGRQVVAYSGVLPEGRHSFTFFAGYENSYVLKATVRGVTRSTKLIGSGSGTGSDCRLIYGGMVGHDPGYKTAGELAGFVFSPGDSLQFIGYSNTAASVIASNVLEDAPEVSVLYTFHVREGMPCSGAPVVHWQGQTYETLKIGSQCWMKDNLNVGTMIPMPADMTDNGTTEKYCYDEDPANCTTYGGLYQWNEIMQYAAQAGVQGICPDGWHIPGDAEWCIVTQEIDPTVDCEPYAWDGTDAGTKMKNSTGWKLNGSGTNGSGFTAIPAGYCDNWFGGFQTLGYSAYFWSSTEITSTQAGVQWLAYDKAGVHLSLSSKTVGFSVRCVRD